MTACPAHSIAEQIMLLAKLFPERHDQQGRPANDLPLFPNARGSVCSKQDMVDTIRAAARILKLPSQSIDGTHQLTGHSLRVTGAQGLAAAGLETWAIQLLGRWGSDTVLQYIREAPLAASKTWASKVAGVLTLNDVVRQVQSVPATELAVAPDASRLNASVRAWLESRLGRFADELVAVHDRQGEFDCRLSEVEAALAAEVHLVCSQPMPEASGDLVWNVNSGIVQRIRKDSHSSDTLCSWKFSLSESALPCDTLPACHRSICGRCLPHDHAAAKQRLLSTCVSSHAGVGQSGGSDHMQDQYGPTPSQ